MEKLTYKQQKFTHALEALELLDISEARNATTHDYDEENAQEICRRIGGYYITFKKLQSIVLL